MAHAPLSALLDETAEPSKLAAELERGGHISVETLRRVACDATIAIAVDDDVGHTMYEGRATRDPTDAQRRELRRRDRDCRFPSCTNATFTNPHHVKPWKPDGPTDLENLCLLCEYHHHVVHSRGWTVSGSANEELTFVGPTGRVMTSRPSPLWARGAADGLSGGQRTGSSQTRTGSVRSSSSSSSTVSSPSPGSVRISVASTSRAM